MPPAALRLIAHGDLEFQVDRAMEHTPSHILAAMRHAEADVIRSVYRTVLGRLSKTTNPPARRAHEEERE